MCFICEGGDIDIKVAGLRLVGHVQRMYSNDKIREKYKISHGEKGKLEGPNLSEWIIKY